MTNPAEIRKPLHQRLEEAKVLYQNGLCDGAFYLAGYCVELTLKAKICERLGVPNLFDKTNSTSSAVQSISEFRKPFLTHNLFILLVFSGLKVKFDADKATNKELAKANSLLFNQWDEEARYKPCGFMENADMKKLLDLLSSPTGIISWIEKN